MLLVKERFAPTAILSRGHTLEERKAAGKEEILAVAMGSSWYATTAEVRITCGGGAQHQTLRTIRLAAKEKARAAEANTTLPTRRWRIGNS